MAKHKVVEIPASNIKKDMTRILFEKGYILNYKFEKEGPQGNIKIALKYHPETDAAENQTETRKDSKEPPSGADDEEVKDPDET